MSMSGLDQFISQMAFLAHGYCFQWDGTLITMHVASDAAIVLAYFSLPVFLFVLAKNRPDLSYGWAIHLFGLFIFGCGLTHLFGIWTLWVPDYFSQGIVKVFTALVSVATAIAVWPLLPRLRALPSHSQLLDINMQLSEEIAERELAEQKMLRSEAKLLAAQRIAKIGSWETDLETGEEEWSAPLIDLFGGAAVFKHSVERELLDLCDPEDRAVLERTLCDTAPLTKHKETIRLTLDSGEDEHFIIRTYVDAEGCRYGSLQNVTSQKRAELALNRAQRMEAVAQLTGGVAHDFNNLLGIVRVNLELLEMSPHFSDTDRKQLATAINAIERGANLTKKLLSVTQHRSDTEDCSLVDVGEVVRRTQDFIAKSLTQEIEVEVRTESTGWGVTLDQGELQDTLVNLALNARDSMPAGGKLLIENENVTLGDMELQNGRQLTAGDYVVLSVSDTGAGMSRAVQKRIFEPFFTTKEEMKGTGLGLSMVYGFVQRCGGYIAVYSEQGLGTTFKIFLPKARNAQNVPQPALVSEPSIAKGTEAVLVVDDEAPLLKATSGLLEAYGYRVLQANDAFEALSILRSDAGRNVAAIVTDVIMPGMSGVELVNQVREEFPGMAFLLLSGFTGNRLRGPGCDDLQKHILSKPYTKADLLNKLRKALDSRPTTEARALQANV